MNGWGGWGDAAEPGAQLTAEELASLEWIEGGYLCIGGYLVGQVRPVEGAPVWSTTVFFPTQQIASDFLLYFAASAEGRRFKQGGDPDA